MKVRKVTPIHLDEPIPVYDIEVPDNHNFKLKAGVFVHNSKDVSDAVAGVVYGLTTRREIWVNHDIAWNEIPESLTAALSGK